MTTDLDSVIALTVGLLSGSVSTQACDIRMSKVSSDSNSAFHHRTCAVLDALAALCVREPKSDVIAIGCRYHKPETELFIASNNGPPPSSILEHLDSIWYLLCYISNLVHFGKELTTDERAESPQYDITQVYGDISFQQLFIEIFKHTFQVAQKRTTRYWPIVEAFKQQYSSWEAYQESMGNQGRAAAEWKDKETFEQFCGLIGALDSMNEQLIALESKAWIPDPNEVDRLIDTWWFIDDCGKKVLKNRAACDIWAEDVKAVGFSNQPCHLKRAVEKLSTIHLQVGTLLRFAFSPRMRFLLSGPDPHIIPVEAKPPTNKRPMPSTEAQWRKVLQDVFDKLELQLDGTDEEARANEKILFRKALAQGSPIQHCECLLVAYLLCQGSFPTVSYIGLSKLSCKACFLWLQAVGEVTGCRFETKGSHDKWYPRWSAPALEGNNYKDKIDKNFLGKVESELYKNLQASRLTRPRAQSDSSNCSEGGMAVMKGRNLGPIFKEFKTKSGLGSSSGRK